jgi:hypothetical protein
MTHASFVRIIQVLNEAGVRYLVVGGIAVNAHGYVRLTVDVDLMIQLERENLLRGLRALETLGYRTVLPIRWEDMADPRQRQEWIEQKQMKALKLYSDAHRETSIDVFVDDPLGFDAAYSRVKPFPVADNLDAPVCSYQDLVTLKLQASRPKDLDDLQKLKQARGE